MGLGNWIMSFFNKVGAFLKKFWAKAQPALEEILGEVALLLWKTCQALLIEAIEHVNSKGFPNDQAKRDAFKEYMKEHSELEIDKIKDNDFEIIRSLALGAWKKAQTFKEQ